MSTLSVNVTETDFEALADAAGNAYEKGDFLWAHKLDELARRTNAALSGCCVEDCQSPMEVEGYKERILAEVEALG